MSVNRNRRDQNNLLGQSVTTINKVSWPLIKQAIQQLLDEESNQESSIGSIQLNQQCENRYFEKITKIMKSNNSSREGPPQLQKNNSSYLSAAAPLTESQIQKSVIYTNGSERKKKIVKMGKQTLPHNFDITQSINQLMYIQIQNTKKQQQHAQLQNQMILQQIENSHNQDQQQNMQSNNEIQNEGMQGEGANQKLKTTLANQNYQEQSHESEKTHHHQQVNNGAGQQQQTNNILIQQNGQQPIVENDEEEEESKDQHFNKHNAQDNREYNHKQPPLQYQNYIHISKGDDLLKFSEEQKEQENNANNISYLQKLQESQIEHLNNDNVSDVYFDCIIKPQQPINNNNQQNQDQATSSNRANERKDLQQNNYYQEDNLINKQPNNENDSVIPLIDESTLPDQSNQNIDYPQPSGNNNNHHDNNNNHLLRGQNDIQNEVISRQLGQNNLILQNKAEEFKNYEAQDQQDLKQNEDEGHEGHFNNAEQSFVSEKANHSIISQLPFECIIKQSEAQPQENNIIPNNQLNYNEQIEQNPILQQQQQQQQQIQNPLLNNNPPPITNVFGFPHLLQFNHNQQYQQQAIPNFNYMVPPASLQNINANQQWPGFLAQNTMNFQSPVVPTQNTFMNQQFQMNNIDVPAQANQELGTYQQINNQFNQNQQMFPFQFGEQNQNGNLQANSFPLINNPILQTGNNEQQNNLQQYTNFSSNTTNFLPQPFGGLTQQIQPYPLIIPNSIKDDSITQQNNLMMQNKQQENRNNPIDTKQVVGVLFKPFETTNPDRKLNEMLEKKDQERQNQQNNNNIQDLNTQQSQQTNDKILIEKEETNQFQQNLILRAQKSSNSYNEVQQPNINRNESETDTIGTDLDDTIRAFIQNRYYNKQNQRANNFSQVISNIYQELHAPKQLESFKLIDATANTHSYAGPQHLIKFLLSQKSVYKFLNDELKIRIEKSKQLGRKDQFKQITFLLGGYDSSSELKQYLTVLEKAQNTYEMKSRNDQKSSLISKHIPFLDQLSKKDDIQYYYDEDKISQIWLSYSKSAEVLKEKAEEIDRDYEFKRHFITNNFLEAGINDNKIETEQKNHLNLIAQCRENFLDSMLTELKQHTEIQIFPRRCSKQKQKNYKYYSNFIMFCYKHGLDSVYNQVITDLKRKLEYQIEFIAKSSNQEQPFCLKKQEISKLYFDGKFLAYDEFHFSDDKMQGVLEQNKLLANILSRIGQVPQKGIFILSSTEFGKFVEDYFTS